MKTLNCNYELYNSSIISSDNCYVIDKNGNKYIDFESGVWCTSLGHNNRDINRVIAEQIGNISHTGYRYTHNIVDEVAELVIDTIQFDDGKCIFLSSGSEAVEFGVQAAKKIMSKPYFLCFDNYFLSSYGISSSRNNEEWISLDLSNYDGDIDLFLKDVPFDKVGAFIFEPGNASGTVKLPPKDLVIAIENKIKKNNGIIIVDEVTTGIGRTGRWFGFEHYDLKPDIVVCGKGIGNGYPVSVVAMSASIAYRIEQSDFKYAQSHQNDPLGCTIIKEVMMIIKNNDFIQKSAQMGILMDQSFEFLAKKQKCIKEVRGIGLMYVIEFYKDQNINLEKIHRQLFDEGYIVGISLIANLLRFYPPLTIEENMIEGLSNTLDKVLSQ